MKSEWIHQLFPIPNYLIKWLLIKFFLEEYLSVIVVLEGITSTH